MKNIFLSLMILFFSSQIFSQKKNAKVTFEVDGVCMMCKKRIEKAALNTKGVKFAQWNVKTHQLYIIIDERKISEKQVKQRVANAGHDTKDIKAPIEAYNNLHECCKYRSKEIQDNHKR